MRLVAIEIVFDRREKGGVCLLRHSVICEGRRGNRMLWGRMGRKRGFARNLGVAWGGNVCIYDVNGVSG